MRYSVIEDDDILNAEVIVDYILLYDKVWHSDFYIMRIPTSGKKEMGYLYGLKNNDEAIRIKNMCLVSDDGAVVVMIDNIAMQAKADMVTYISDEVFSNLCSMGCLCDDDIPKNLYIKNKN